MTLQRRTALRAQPRSKGNRAERADSRSGRSLIQAALVDLDKTRVLMLNELGKVYASEEQS